MKACTEKVGPNCSMCICKLPADHVGEHVNWHGHKWGTLMGPKPPTYIEQLEQRLHNAEAERDYLSKEAIKGIVSLRDEHKAKEYWIECCRMRETELTAVHARIVALTTLAADAIQVAREWADGPTEHVSITDLRERLALLSPAPAEEK